MGYIMTSKPTATQQRPSVRQYSRRRIVSFARAHTDGDGDVGELALLQGRSDVGDEVAEDDANGHREENPEGQEPVQPA